MEIIYFSRIFMSFTEAFLSSSGIKVKFLVTFRSIRKESTGCGEEIGVRSGVYVVIFNCAVERHSHL